MATADKIKARIIEIAARSKNVPLSDIEWVMNQLKQFGEVEISGNSHLIMWRYETAIFSICTHHKGTKQIKPIYVKSFLYAMIETGWYEE